MELLVTDLGESREKTGEKMCLRERNQWVAGDEGEVVATAEERRG